MLLLISILTVRMHEAELHQHIVEAFNERQAQEEQVSMQQKKGAGAETLLENINQYLKTRETAIQPFQY